MPTLPLTSGDVGEAVEDLHMRLYKAGWLSALPDPIDQFVDATTDAVRSFQCQRKLRADGHLDQATWDALVESGYLLGDRLLYLQRPMVRGDDVEELQRRLGMMGFNAGRVDGIFGPDTLAAVEDFQRNAGLTVDGIAGHETLASMARISSHVGNHTVAAVRENERLRQVEFSIDSCRIVIGELDGQRALGELTARMIRQTGAEVAFIELPDDSAQARAANDYGADVYVGLEFNPDDACRIAYFSVENFESEGGRRLAELIGTEIERQFDDLTVTVEGLRLPVLRETKMPAVVVALGSSEDLVEARGQLAALLATAIETWTTSPVGI